MPIDPDLKPGELYKIKTSNEFWPYGITVSLGTILTRTQNKPKNNFVIFLKELEVKEDGEEDPGHNVYLFLSDKEYYYVYAPMIQEAIDL